MLRTLRALSFCTPFLLLPQATTAQDHCDSLQILHLQYHPFTDSIMNVLVDNTGTHFFSGPLFHLLSAESDTVALGIYEFFGISGGEQTHHMDLAPGVTTPTTPFSGSLVLLSYGWNGPDTCTWPVQAALCPPGDCTPLNVYLYNATTWSEPFTTSFGWNVSAVGGGVVASGTLAIDANGVQQVIGDLCLPPGQYVLHMEQPEAVGVQYTFGLCQGGEQFLNPGPTANLSSGGQLDLPFSYYASCLTGTDGVLEPTASAPMLVVDGRALRVSTSDGTSLHQLSVVDPTGRVLLRTRTSASSAVLDLQALPAGAYLLCGEKGWSAQRFVLP